MQFKQLAIVILFLGSGTVAMWFITSKASNLDWWLTDDKVLIGDSIAFPGCALSKSIDDPGAMKKAVIRAQANLVRSKKVSISGAEQSKSSGYANNYSLSVSETAEAYMKPTVVVEKKLVVIDDMSQLCVLVMERH
jgi:hypothetical protein